MSCFSPFGFSFGHNIWPLLGIGLLVFFFINMIRNGGG